MIDKLKIEHLFTALTFICSMLVCQLSNASQIKVMAWNVMAEITAEQFTVFDPEKKLNLKSGQRIEQPYVKWPQLRFDNRAIPIIKTIESENPDVIGLTEMMRCDDPKNDAVSGTGNIPYMVYLLRSKGYEVFPRFPHVEIENGELYFLVDGKRTLNIPKSADQLEFVRKSTDADYSQEPQNACSAFSPTPYIAFKKNRFIVKSFPSIQPIAPKINPQKNVFTYWMSSSTAVLHDLKAKKDFVMSVIHADPASAQQRKKLVEKTIALFESPEMAHLPKIFVGDFNIWASKKSVGNDLSDASCKNYDFGDNLDATSNNKSGFVDLWSQIVGENTLGFQKPLFTDALAFANPGICLNTVNSFIHRDIDPDCSISPLTDGVSMQNGTVHPEDKRRVDYIFVSEFNVNFAGVVKPKPTVVDQNYALDVDLKDRDRVHDCSGSTMSTKNVNENDKCFIPEKTIQCGFPFGQNWNKPELIVHPSDHFPVLAVISY